MAEDLSSDEEDGERKILNHLDSIGEIHEKNSNKDSKEDSKEDSNEDTEDKNNRDDRERSESTRTSDGIQHQHTSNSFENAMNVVTKTKDETTNSSITVRHTKTLSTKERRLREVVHECRKHNWNRDTLAIAKEGFNPCLVLGMGISQSHTFLKRYVSKLIRKIKKKF